MVIYIFFYLLEARGQFTFWSLRKYNTRQWNKGLRLDYFICSGDMFPEDTSLLKDKDDGGVTATEDKISTDTCNIKSDTNNTTNTTSKVCKVQVHDSLILHEDTIDCSDHCPILLIMKL